jgi:hypothetical protein
MPNQGSKNPRVYSGSINRNCSKNIVARLLLAHTRWTLSQPRNSRGTHNNIVNVTMQIFRLAEYLPDIQILTQPKVEQSRNSHLPSQRDSCVCTCMRRQVQQP